MRPLVTVLITAYNYGAYVGRAIDSALGQEYPVESLDIVVVDDGSTDDTADVVRRYADRGVRYVWQPNSGVMAATARGIEEARGQFIAFLDADDMWLPHRVRTQVETLLERPEVGLVSGEMEIVDDDDRTTTRRYFGELGIVPPSGWAMGTYIRQNLSPTATIMVRSSLKHAIYPIPEDASYQDWWVSACLAERTEFLWTPDPVARYRAHTGQISSFQVHDAAWIKVQQKDNRFRRWIFRNLDLGRVSLPDAIEAWAKLDEHVRLVSRSWGVPASDLLPVTDEDCARARALAARAAIEIATGDHGGAARTLLAALAENPFDLELRTLFDSAARAVDPDNDPMLPGTRGFVALARACELLQAPDLLSTYAEAFNASDDATLVIDVDEASVAPLGRLIAELALDNSSSPDMVAVSLADDRATEALLDRRVHALLTARDDGGLAVERFGPGSVGELRRIAEDVWQARPRHFVDRRLNARLIEQGQAA